MTTGEKLLLVAFVARLVVEGGILWMLWKRAELVRGALLIVAVWVAKAGRGAWSPVAIDGALWTSLALFAFWSTTLSSDEAYKDISPTGLFWMKFSVGSLAASCTALKAFRSTTYSDSQRAKQVAIAGLPPEPPPGAATALAAAGTPGLPVQPVAATVGPLTAQPTKP